MKCPHCLENFHDSPTVTDLRQGDSTLTDREKMIWKVRARLCPACGRAIVMLFRVQWVTAAGKTTPHEVGECQVWPKGFARAPLPSEVTDPYAADYREACNVLADSPKASAALGRRCLQGLLRDKAGVAKGNLHSEIEAVITSHTPCRPISPRRCTTSGSSATSPRTPRSP
jgi:Domain of unknown function (DUF4145)